MIRLESPDQPEVTELIGELDAYQSSLYPKESNHLLDLAALLRPTVLFAVARDPAGHALACGAIVVTPAFAEIKRMFVRPVARGQGLGRALLGFLEAEAARHGCQRLMLETGVRQPEALRLYEGAGYTRRSRFGVYPDDRLSVFMEKPLTALDFSADTSSV